MRRIWENPPKCAAETDCDESELDRISRNLRYRGDVTYNDKHPLIGEHLRNVDVSDAKEYSSE